MSKCRKKKEKWFKKSNQEAAKCKEYIKKMTEKLEKETARKAELAEANKRLDSLST